MTSETAAETASTQGFDFVALAHESELWIAVSFLIFVALFARYVAPMILRSLDGRAAKIRDQLEQASRLRAEAEALLHAYQAEREAKEKEAESIILSAQKDAEELRTRAAADLKASIDRRSQQAVEKIARAEQDAMASIRNEMIESATKAVREIIRTQLETGGEDQAVARALQAIEQQIH